MSLISSRPSTTNPSRLRLLHYASLLSADPSVPSSYSSRLRAMVKDRTNSNDDRFSRAAATSADQDKQQGRQQRRRRQPRRGAAAKGGGGARNEGKENGDRCGRPRTVGGYLGRSARDAGAGKEVKGRVEGGLRCDFGGETAGAKGKNGGSGKDICRSSSVGDIHASKAGREGNVDHGKDKDAVVRVGGNKKILQFDNGATKNFNVKSDRFEVDGDCDCDNFSGAVSLRSTNGESWSEWKSAIVASGSNSSMQLTSRVADKHSTTLEFVPVSSGGGGAGGGRGTPGGETTKRRDPTFVVAGGNATYAINVTREVCWWGTGPAAGTGNRKGKGREQRAAKNSEENLPSSSSSSSSSSQTVATVQFPQYVKFPAVISKISAGHEHAAAADIEGKCYTWGNGADGRLGHGDCRGR